MQQEVGLNCRLKSRSPLTRVESSRERGQKSSRSAIVLDRSCSSTRSISGSKCDDTIAADCVRSLCNILVCRHNRTIRFSGVFRISVRRGEASSSGSDRGEMGPSPEKKSCLSSEEKHFLSIK